MQVATPEQVKALDAIKAKLWPLARKFDAPPMHWVGGGDEGFDYCFKCAEVEVARLQAKHPDKADDYCVDGGWDGKRESDCSSACKGCRCTLGYSLTHHGFLEEVYHFADSIIGPVVDPGTAYELEAVMDAAEYDSDEDAIATAIRVGLEAVAAIDKAADFDHLATMRWADDGGCAINL